MKNILKFILLVLKYSSIFLLIHICVIVLLSSLFFLFGYSITPINFSLSTIITIILVISLFRKLGLKKIFLSIALSALIFIVSIICCSHTFDITWDGNTYHKLAVGMLKDGWNPVYEKSIKFIKSQKYVSKIKDDGENSIWIEHYPKASWIFSANVYSVTGNIESSKIMTFLFMYITFSIFINYLYKKTNIFFSFLLSTFLAINPISIVQVFSYYIDGLMGLSIYIILYALIKLTDEKLFNNSKDDEIKNENWIILASSLIICINLKFTGLIYAAFFCIMFFVLWLYKDYKDGVFKEKVKKYLLCYTVIVFIALCLVGTSSYVKNTIVKKNPLYPLVGKNKVDIMTYNEPLSFQKRGPLDKFYLSMFGISENVKSNDTTSDPILKVPFSIYDGEFDIFRIPDVRISGFGVLFSGIFILSLICIIVFMIINHKKKENKSEYTNYIYSFIGVCFVLIMIVDGSWWARYVPYLYLFPIIGILFFLMQKKIIYKTIAFSICVLLLINNLAIFNTSIYNCIDRYEYISIEFEKIRNKNEHDKIVYIALKKVDFTSVLYNLSDNKINVKLVNVKNMSLPKYVNFFYYDQKTLLEEVNNNEENK